MLAVECCSYGSSLGYAEALPVGTTGRVALGYGATLPVAAAVTLLRKSATIHQLSWCVFLSPELVDFSALHDASLSCLHGQHANPFTTLPSSGANLYQMQQWLASSQAA
jgi:hypothetical protein